MILTKAIGLLCSASLTLAQITVYGQLPLGQTAVTSAAWATTTVRAAYNDTRLLPPDPPTPPANVFTLQLQKDVAAVAGVSIPHVGPSFYGFSIEMSVINQVVGKNSSFIHPTFLNLMANLAERAGGVVVRLGGNTQEYAALVDANDPRLEPGHSFGKALSSSTGTTLTPSVMYTMEMFYMAGNISSMVNVKWFLGIPFNDSVNWRLAIAEHGQEILGDNLLGLQAGNEPDFYVQFGRRQAPYTPLDYFREVGELIKVLDANPKIKNKNMLIGPSTSGQVWHPEDVWETGFIPTYKDRLFGLTVEHYPHDNCAAMYDSASGRGKIPQNELPYYLNHDNVIELVRPYWNSGILAAEAGKPFMMFETNSASCGGFPGISDTYTSALWGLDYGFQMAQANFTHALLHIGGQNVFYNPFTAPPTEQAGFNLWTLGPIYYSALVMAEAFGKTNTSRIVDLRANNGNPSTPSYAIFERDILSKVALFNYVDDPTGANSLVVSLTVNGGVPASVSVKYLLASSIAEKNNITWAGQTFGNKYTVDGRLRDTLNVTTISCDQGQNVCRVPVPSPGFALVFFGSDSEALTISQSPKTFSTTAWMKKHNTATYDQKALETSNGHGGKMRAPEGAGTSFGSKKHDAGIGGDALVRSAMTLGAAMMGAGWVVRALVR